MIHKNISALLSFAATLIVLTVGQPIEEGIVASNKQIIGEWPPASKISGASAQDLHREYNSIFLHGNRNAASHRWSTFILDRANQMVSHERLDLFFSAFCSVSGSPVRPSDYNRYRLTLGKVGDGTNRTSGDGGGGGYSTGYMHYCCWPCVCDTQDFIKIDTLNVTTGDGITQTRHFTVIGNPCDHPEKLTEPFKQPFDVYGRSTTLAETAREVRCLENGIMEGATLSDHGYVIIGMFFDAVDENINDDGAIAGNEVQLSMEKKRSLSTVDGSFFVPTPGRISKAVPEDGKKTITFQDEREWGGSCKEREDNGHNSGMGEIFRKVCEISPILNTDAPVSLPSPSTTSTASINNNE